jgi:hypothetical protein
MPLAGGLDVSYVPEGGNSVVVYTLFPGFAASLSHDYVACVTCLNHKTQLDHLGFVAGTIKELRIIDMINERIGTSK